MIQRYKSSDNLIMRQIMRKDSHGDWCRWEEVREYLQWHKRKLMQCQKALAFANSMILSGEQHSAESAEIMNEALSDSLEGDQ